MNKLFYLALAGALGTLARVALSQAAAARLGDALPWGTLVVNVLGSVLFGIVFAATEQSPIAPAVRLYALAGFMGAFTTFSSLMFDVSALASTGRWSAAVLTLALHNLLGLAAFALGLGLGRLV